MQVYYSLDSTLALLSLQQEATSSAPISIAIQPSFTSTTTASSILSNYGIQSPLIYNPSSGLSSSNSFNLGRRKRSILYEAYNISIAEFADFSDYHSDYGRREERSSRERRESNQAEVTKMEKKKIKKVQKPVANGSKNKKKTEIKKEKMKIKKAKKQIEDNKSAAKPKNPIKEQNDVTNDTTTVKTQRVKNDLIKARKEERIQERVLFRTQTKKSRTSKTSDGSGLSTRKEERKQERTMTGERRKLRKQRRRRKRRLAMGTRIKPENVQSVYQMFTAGKKKWQRMNGGLDIGFPFDLKTGELKSSFKETIHQKVVLRMPGYCEAVKLEHSSGKMKECKKLETRILARLQARRRNN
ncbi:uncharacterized protein LOC111706249 isoform X2 [Eurytemora carolleeae]|uniref:uncharacterized protein LOC111706249 isoform X2 n=1 Tax=Eurytemora carolleeae TaxID=1294199 RepID=UPI000C7789A4|nr:uncharacterized protein LOC111706249 isoform X2 [Eurytemora carolleeae]|eukprot:XP_023334843.1 uncharacterized protein LOC111706249 isoform X2 [Eurytemora affinis]